MLTGILAGLAAGALWGLVFVLPRVLPGYGSVDVMAGRLLVYGLCAAGVMLLSARGRQLPTWSQAAVAAGLSVLGFTGYFLLLVLALRDAGSALPTLIIGTIPIWVMVLGKPENLRWAALLPGAALTVLGMALMSWAEPAAAQGDAVHFWRGIAYAVAAMVSWTAFALLNAAWLRRHPQVRASDWANWLGIASGAGALVLWLVLGSAPQVLVMQHGLMLPAICFIATGLGSAWLATLLWNVASRRLSPSLCGQLIVSETLFGLFYAFVWDGQWPSLWQWLAALAFTLGIVASIRAHR
ncbi:DMT family transporter [Variovorax sp. HJSM1_2]|uniref:DMT family transporter n=1 Tax=Variovorax sp. HJSM1_2 TaxID=3366263 RepID=UPI003BD10DC6